MQFATLLWGSPTETWQRKAVRLALVTILAFLCLADSTCPEPRAGPRYSIIYHHPKLGYFRFRKDTATTEVIVWSPTGWFRAILPPNVYLNAIDSSTTEQGYYYAGPSSNARQHRAAASTSAPEYVWILSNYPTNAVYVFDSSLNLVSTITLPEVPNPLGIVANHAGTEIYVTVQQVQAGIPGISPAPPTVEVISASTLQITGVLNLPSNITPGKPVLSLDDRYLYIPSSSTVAGTAASAVLVVDTTNPSSVTPLPISIPSDSLARALLSPDGNLLFAATIGQVPGRVYVFDTNTQQQIGVFTLPSLQRVNDLAIDPTGSHLYVLGAAGAGPQTQWTGYLNAYDTASLTPISTVTLEQNGDPGNLSISPDGAMLFAADLFSATVFSIDPFSLAVTQLSPPPVTDASDASFTVAIP